MSDASKAIRKAIDKFEVEDTTPYLEQPISHSPTGSYGTWSSGLKQVYNLKGKNLLTKSVIKSSGILASNFPSYTGYGP